MTPAEHIAQIRDILDEMAMEGHFTEFEASTYAGAIEHELCNLLDVLE